MTNDVEGLVGRLEQRVDILETAAVGEVPVSLTVIRNIMDDAELHSEAAAALTTLQKKHDILCQAINADEDTCDDSCNSHGHSEACTDKEMALMRQLRESITIRVEHRAQAEAIAELRLALFEHRADLHQSSSRPCGTCRDSAEALGMNVPDRCPTWVESKRDLEAWLTAHPTEGN